MKGSENKRYTKKHVIIMLVLAFLLTAAVSYAWNLSVPNTFSPNTTISSSAMNANFDYVDSRLGAANIFFGSSSTITTSNQYSNPLQLATAQFYAPQNGYVIVQAHAYYAYESRNDTACTQYLYAGVGQTTTAFNTSQYFFDSKSVAGTSMLTINSQVMFYVSQGSLNTYYFNAARNDSCTSNSFYIGGPRLTIMFFPTYL